MTADTETLREALEAAVAMDAEWWNMEHSAALAALRRVEERERALELARRVIDQIDYPTIVTVSKDGGRSIDMWRELVKILPALSSAAGEECDGSMDCKATKHIHGCFRSSAAGSGEE